jgi:hypothetical protein
MILPPEYVEEDGLEPVGKFAALVIVQLAAQFFQPANADPAPASEIVA